MRAVRVSQLEGPAAVTVEEIDEPTAEGPFGPQLLVEVHAVGISFPDLLLSKGEYQLKPELPFTLGVDFAGVVRSAPDGSGFAEGDRVAAVLGNGGASDVVGPRSGQRLPAARLAELRAGRRHPDELPDRPLRARRARLR